MIARLPRLLIVLALASTIGLHWAFLQSVAWVGMIVTYSQDAPLAEAVVKTFDGQHPCKLCKQISAAKKSERKSPASISMKKQESVPVRIEFVFSAPQEFDLLPEQSFALRGLARTPPTPPPRPA